MTKNNGNEFFIPNYIFFFYSRELDYTGQLRKKTFMFWSFWTTFAFINLIYITFGYFVFIYDINIFIFRWKIWIQVETVVIPRSLAVALAPSMLKFCWNRNGSNHWISAWKYIQTNLPLDQIGKICIFVYIQIRSI